MHSSVWWTKLREISHIEKKRWFRWKKNIKTDLHEQGSEEWIDKDLDKWWVL